MSAIVRAPTALRGRSVLLVALAACVAPEDGDDDCRGGETDVPGCAAADTDPVGADTDDTDAADTGPGTPSPPTTEIAVLVSFGPLATEVWGGALQTRWANATIEAWTVGSCDVRKLTFPDDFRGGVTRLQAGGLTGSIDGRSFSVEPADDGAWSGRLEAVAPTEVPATVTIATAGVEGAAPAFAATGHRPSDLVLDRRLDGTTIPRDVPLVVTFPAQASGTATISLAQSVDAYRSVSVTCRGDVADGRITVGTDALAALEPAECTSGSSPCVRVVYGVVDEHEADLGRGWTGRLSVEGTVRGPGSTELAAERIGVAP